MYIIEWTVSYREYGVYIQINCLLKYSRTLTLNTKWNTSLMLAPVNSLELVLQLQLFVYIPLCSSIVYNMLFAVCLYWAITLSKLGSLKQQDNSWMLIYGPREISVLSLQLILWDHQLDEQNTESIKTILSVCLTLCINGMCLAHSRITRAGNNKHCSTSKLSYLQKSNICSVFRKGPCGILTW